uniref:Uncharacterized protein n=1 Tax=Arundo donax TaxID=35708 RepID=A0A0A9ATP9_ARUDO
MDERDVLYISSLYSTDWLWSRIFGNILIQHIQDIEKTVFTVSW